MDDDTRKTLDRLARSQSGHLTTEQLLRTGLARATVWRWGRSGRLVPVGRRTFRMPGVARTDHGDVVAACLDLDAVASHRTAAWVHGLAPRPRQIDVTVRRSGSVHTGERPPDAPRIRVHTSTNLPADDVLRVDGVLVTSVARTVLGVAALVPEELDGRQLVELVSAAIDRDLATLPWFWWLLERRRRRGRNGVTAMEAALAQRSRLGPTESWLERELLRVIEAAGLPAPKTQRVFQRQGRFAARVDFAYDGSSIVLEALGYAFHRTKEQLEADTRRAAELQVLGLQVYQFTSDQIVQRPGWVAGIVAAALGGHAASQPGSATG